VACFCEQGNESLDFITGEEFLVRLSCHQLSKRILLYGDVSSVSL
jgi:hypothetical protein